MVSLIELERAARILQGRFSGSWLKRVSQPDEHSLVLTIQPPRATDAAHIRLSCRPGFARISECETAPPAQAEAVPFMQFLKARMERARLDSASILDRDRQVLIQIRSREEILQILLSILGARSNIYLLDEAGVVRFALRPLDKTRKDLEIGRPWSSPFAGTRSPGEDRWEKVADSDFLRTIERTYAVLEREKELEDLSRKVAQALKKEAEFLARKSLNLQEDLAGAAQGSKHRKLGELLKGVLHTIRPGDQQAVAFDFETGEEVKIELDPRLSPSANLEQYFRRYQKEQRGVEALERQVARVQQERSILEGLREEFERALAMQDLAGVEKFAARQAVRRLIGRHVRTSRAVQGPGRPAVAKKEVPSRLLPKRFRSADGFEVWVGRSDEGNDYLTTRLARGNDLFLHLDGSPGSHVILRTEGRNDPPSESLLDACELAVHFSKQKNASRVDVHVTPVKNVRKPKGAKRGLVYVLRGKTIHLRRDRNRLARVLASRLDE